jgi:accessory gene regulator B
LTDFLLNKNIVSRDDREIYIYGFEALLSTVLNAFLVLITGILIGLLKETLIFLMGFALLRVYSGGYHAKTHLGCILTFAGIYGISMAIITFLPEQYTFFVSSSAGVLSLLFILINAPLEHKNRPFVDNEYKTFKFMARTVVVLEGFIIALILIFFNQHSKAALLLSLAMFSVMFVLALAKIIDKKR